MEQRCGEPGSLELCWSTRSFLPGLPEEEELRAVREVLDGRDFAVREAVRQYWSVPERLTDLLCALRANGLEPKRLRFVCKTAADAPSLVLAEARRGGKPGLTIEAPLILQNSDGTPTPEVDAIYFRQQEDTP